MKIVEPKIFLIGETQVIEEGLQEYLNYLELPDWQTDAQTDIEKLIEVMGRLCYRSFAPGLNLNVTKVRSSNKIYLDNIIKVGHGSVLEHSVLNFIFADVSRVFTHELVRHRAGTAASQESLRFVRLDDLKMWVPTVVLENSEVMDIFVQTFKQLEDLQKMLAQMYNLDNKSFDVKKKITSAMRRLAPDGLATTIGWSTNIRALRHILEMRTAPEAEEEIRLVFGKVGALVKERYPVLFADYQVEIVDNLPWYRTENRKV